MTTFYCGLCDHAAADADQARAHVEAQHPGFIPWLTERLGAVPVAIGAAVWYWNQDQDPARAGWQPATVIGWGGKDGCHVYDVQSPNGWIKWGWAWQVVTRSGSPSDPPAMIPKELIP